ncbi:hypothetical protein AAG570_011005 [Ranatra chinensis]|uniref:deoxyribose-phosphate aldolase n=1 Tax=Ranatra chinensis TaxID=642074 RepID=A0ABD0YJC5_9HEMI
MLENSPEIGGQFETAWLLKAVTCTDLTTLAGDDTSSNVIRLCTKAVNPISKEILAKLHENEIEKKFLYDITTAAVCVYPSRVPDAVQHLTKLNAKLPVASVATGFPSGQYPLSTKLQEISYCVSQGASEIDVVIDRSLVLAQKWEQLYNEIKQMKIACGPAHMKTILAVGECGSFDNIYKASLVAMMAGSDFIKTSTGKESVNATLPVGLVMCRAIRNFHSMTGIKVGLKPAGGIRLCEDAINWLKLVKHELGSEWLNPKLFRIGASGLLIDIEKRLFYLANNRQAPSYYFLAI